MTKAWAPFGQLIQSVGLCAFDVGARGNTKMDLRPIASGVDWVCLEPDQHAPLGDAGYWRSVTHSADAVAASSGSFALNLYRQRGCSSRFEADGQLAARFARGDYYQLDEVVDIAARPLDDIAETLSRRVDFLKIDVQGMEVECFQGAHNALERDLVGIRTEVSFFPIYRSQPLFAEVDQALRPYGLHPMRWLEMHSWRRRDRSKWPRLGDSQLPFSRGQLVHADVLYLLQPEDLPKSTEDELKRIVRLGLVSLCYDLLDHAEACFSVDEVLEYVRPLLPDPLEAVAAVSHARVAQTRWSRLLERTRDRLQR